VELRPATPDDVEAMHRLFLVSIAEVFRPHGFEPPAPPLDVFANQQLHVQGTGHALVATAPDGHLLGYAGAWSRDGDWFLASLFVSPDAQGRGVGSALLDGVWGEHARRRTITDAIQPVSNVLYGRRGLLALTPILWFGGLPAVRPDVPPAAAEETVSLAAIDLAAYGFDRSVDHTYWERLARRTVSAGAYSYAFPGGSIGPVAGETPAAAAAALTAELARAEEPVALRIPASSRALVEVALRAGLRLSPVPGLLLGSACLQPPSALAIGGYTLF
jgi:GNAT superfamily N-acetyltransferase